MMRHALRFIINVFIGVLLSIPVSAQDTPRPLYALPDSTDPVYTGSTATTLGRSQAVTVNRLANTLSIVNLTDGSIETELATGNQPVALALIPGTTRIAVLNWQDGTLSLFDTETVSLLATYSVGTLPFSLVARSESEVYISRQGSHDILQMNLTDGTIVRRIPTPNFPSGLALWGDFLYVTHFWSGEISLIYLPAGQVVQTIRTGSQAGFSPSIALDTRNGLAYIPQTIRNNSPYTPFDARALPVIQVLDLATMQVLRDQQIPLHIIGQPVNLPYAVALNSTADTLFIASAGSNDVSVIDLETRTLQAFYETDASPRSLFFSSNNQTIYAHNTIDNTLTAAGTSFFDVEDIFPVSLQPIDYTRLLGVRLFHTASDSRMSTRNALSCATCHFEGQSDGQTWAGINTPSLYNLSQTAPYTWQGNWDTLTEIEAHIRAIQAGSGIGQDSIEMAALVDYLNTLTPPPAPDVQSADQIQRGEDLFERLGCNTCHIGETGTDNLAYDVGTGGIFVTPPLQSLWLTAPYLHNGMAADLVTVFTTGTGVHRLPVDVSQTDIQALVAYLLQRD